MAGLSRGLRPWWAAACCLVACAALVTASTSGLPTRPGPVALPGGRATTSLRVLQMNLCGSGDAHCYTGRSVLEAGEMIRAQDPDVVTLNEVCRDDVTGLERTLAEAGTGADDVVVSAFQAAWDRRTGTALRCRGGGAYGIGLVARLTRVPGGYDTIGGAFPVQDVRNAEERAWVCLSPAAAAAGAVAACTTHLASSSPAVARAQCGYLLGTAIPAVRARAGSVPVVLGGDLNLRSGGSPDVRSCVPAGDGRADDGLVQHVVASSGLTISSLRTIGMLATDHPGLLVTLTREPFPEAAPAPPVAGRQ